MIWILVFAIIAGFIAMIVYSNEQPFGKVKMDLRVDSGDTRVTTTQKYIITEECTGADGFGRPVWKKIDIKPREKEDEQD